MIAKLCSGVFRQDVSHVFRLEISLDPRRFDLVFKGRFQQRRIAEGRDLFNVFQITVAVLVELVLQKWHGKRHIGLLERAGTAGDDGEKQRQQHQQADDDGDDSIELETALGSVAAFGPPVLHQQGRTARVCKRGCGVGDIAHSYCSRYLRTM